MSVESHDPALPSITESGSTYAPITPLSVWRLIRVETRKLLDTRAGRAILMGVITLAVAVSIWQLFTADQPTLNVAMYLQAPGQMIVMITPLVGLVAMTSEFTQRTALSTFTLAPWRLKVLSAKAIAATAITTVVTVLCLAISWFGAILTSASSGAPASYDGAMDSVRGLLITSVLMSILGMAIGALIPQTAVAASSFFVAPVAFSILAGAVLKDNARWFDIFSTFERLSSDAPFAEFGQTTTAVLIWIVIPAAFGAVRAVRREVK